MQHATTLKSYTETTTYIADRHCGMGSLWRLALASCCGWPPTPPTAVAVGDVGGRTGGGAADFKGHRDSLLSDANIVTRN